MGKVLLWFVGFLCLVKATQGTLDPMDRNYDEGVADVIFLLDGSGSVGEDNFEIVKEWVGKVMENMIERHVHVGVIQYSYYYRRKSILDQPYIRVEIPLGGHPSLEEFKKLVSGIELIGYTTYTARGLDRTLLEFNDHGRTSSITTRYCKMAIVVTDGSATDHENVSSSAEKLRAAGVNVISVGVGSINKEELRLIASGNKSSDLGVVVLDNFESIHKITNYINTNIESCGANREPPELDYTTSTAPLQTTPLPTTTPRVTEPADSPMPDLDIIFIIDGSCSITTEAFNRAKTWVSSVAEKLKQYTSIHIGLIQYSNWFSGLDFLMQPQMTSVVLLGSYDHEIFQLSMRAMIQHGGGSSTGHALERALYDFHLHGRKHVCKVAVVLTDGNSNDYELMITNAHTFHECNIETFAFGVGDNYNVAELNLIATQNRKGLNRVHHLPNNHEELAKHFIEELREICH